MTGGNLRVSNVPVKYWTAGLTAASAGQPSPRCCGSRILSVGYSIPLHNTTVAKLVNWMVARWVFLCV